MPQIPVFNGSQRLEPGNPVAAVSTDDARATGNQIAALGKEVFGLGNALDAVAKKAKDNEDRLRVTTAVNQARLEMLKEKARQDSMGLQPGDSPDGVDGINRYNEKINPILSDIASSLESPEQRKAFEAGISDDVVTYSTQVLAGEVAKREKTIPILMEDNLRQRGVLARSTPDNMTRTLQTTEQMAAEYEMDVMGNSMIQDAAKPKLILDGKKQIAHEALMGFIDAGNKGSPKAWNDYRFALNEKFAQLFTAEEKDKLMTDVNSSEYSFYNREYQNVVRKNALEDRAAKETVKNRTAMYMSMLSQAGNSDTKRAPILRQIEMDAALDFDPSSKKRLIENRTFMETSDDAYQLNIMDKLLRDKNYTATLDKLQVDAGARVSIDRATKLQAAIRNLQEHERTNPGLTEAYRKAQEALASYGKPMLMQDPLTGLYKTELDTATKTEQFQFSQWWSNALQKGGVTPGQIEARLNYHIGKMGQVPVRNVPGLPTQNLRSTKDIGDLQEQMYRKFKAGEINTPQKKKEFKNQLIELQRMKDQTRKKEDAAVIPKPGTNSKIFDE